MRVSTIVKKIPLLFIMTVVGGLLFLSFSGMKIMSVQSGSMEPALSRGDLLFARAQDEYRVGDIISFTHNNIVVTHRIVEIKKTEMNTLYLTQGDANSVQDAPVSEASVIGKVVVYAPYMGYIVDLLKTPIGLIVGLYIPAFAVVANELRRLKTHYGRINYSRGNHVVLMLLVLPMSIISIPLTAHAAIQSSARLSGTTLRTVPLLGSNTISCTSNSNVIVNSSTSQNASSGSVNVSGNSSSHSANSGSVQNSSMQNVTVSIVGC